MWLQPHSPGELLPRDAVPTSPQHSFPSRPSTQTICTRDHSLWKQPRGQDSISKIPSHIPLVGATSGPRASCTLVPVLEGCTFFPATSLSSLSLCHVPSRPMAKGPKWLWHYTQNTMTMVFSATVQALRLCGHVLGPVCASQFLEADNRAPWGSDEAGSPWVWGRQDDPLNALALKWGTGTRTEVAFSQEITLQILPFFMSSPQFCNFLIPSLKGCYLIDSWPLIFTNRTYRTQLPI